MTADQIVLLSAMTRLYGAVFTGHFVQAAARRPQAKSVVTVTDADSVKPRVLVARGFELLSDDGRLQLWVHPSGAETWVLRRGVAAESGAAEKDPAVTEAQSYAEDVTAARDALRSELASLRSRIGTVDYPRRYQDHINHFNKWQEELNTILDERVEALKREVDSPQRESLDVQLRRLAELLRWKQEEWPHAIQELPPP